MQSSPPLNASVAEAVRRELGAQRMPNTRLAKAIGKSNMYVSRRLSGEVPFDVSDLEAIARVLGVPVGQFLPAEARA